MTSDRKLAHIQICLEHDVQGRAITTGLEDISFVHHATTDLNLNEIDLSCEIFNKKLSIPLIISGMTGGHDFTHKLNAFLSQAVEQTNIGMGVGSQRAALENDEVKESFNIVREKAPNSLIIGNIGAGQIAQGLTNNQFQELIDMIKADAIAVHFNPLQEAIQPEGDTELKGLHEKTRQLIQAHSVPVIAKEVGAGFSLHDIRVIKKMGFQAIDVQGAGGTSWAGVEAIRTSLPKFKNTGEVYWDWGIPTVLSTILAKRNFDGIIIGSGGVRSGLDIAKLIALGADAAGIAIPFLFTVQQHSAEAVVQKIEEITYQLRVACFLTGSRNISELKKVPLIITGKTAGLLKIHGLDLSAYYSR
ncbi:MAG: type 2 isopentenyl-diphosphate Delta-isomerase [Candidatus Heimdallarchaeota archaeon]|nr:MAG: type 2 isopentenyl-diphosphate Delta-isomerase [Candidatus Heimdallarchaeota archaeon]